MSILN